MVCILREAFRAEKQRRNLIANGFSNMTTTAQKAGSGKTLTPAIPPHPEGQSVNPPTYFNLLLAFAPGHSAGSSHHKLTEHLEVNIEVISMITVA